MYRKHTKTEVQPKIVFTICKRFAIQKCRYIRVFNSTKNDTIPTLHSSNERIKTVDRANTSGHPQNQQKGPKLYSSSLSLRYTPNYKIRSFCGSVHFNPKMRPEMEMLNCEAKQIRKDKLKVVLLRAVKVKTSVGNEISDPISKQVQYG